MSKNKGGTFQRSEDGVTWEDVGEKVMRSRLAGSYRKVDPVVDDMVAEPDKYIASTGFARYRFHKDEANV